MEALSQGNHVDSNLRLFPSLKNTGCQDRMLFLLMSGWLTNFISLAGRFEMFHFAPESRKKDSSLVYHQQTVVVAFVDVVHLLQCTASGFGVEYPDYDAKDNVENKEDDVCPPTNVRNGYRRYLNDQIIENPITGCGEGG